MRFSVITPVYIYDPKRHNDLLRAINSVANQTISPDNFEHIVQDEGSPIELQPLELIKQMYPWLKYEKTEHHIERINNYCNAFKRATGDWFVLLDSDDMLSPYQLEILSQAIDANPEYKLFNFGSVHIHKDGRVMNRDPFKPMRLETGHEVFGGGKIVNGTFIFHRSLYDELGAFPYGYVEWPDQAEQEKLYGRTGRLAMSSPWDFSAWAQLEFPEIRPYFQVDHWEEPRKIIKEMG